MTENEAAPSLVRVAMPDLGRLHALGGEISVAAFSAASRCASRRW
jgi:hypothetical protein